MDRRDINGVMLVLKKRYEPLILVDRKINKNSDGKVNVEKVKLE